MASASWGVREMGAPEGWDSSVLRFSVSQGLTSWEESLAPHIGSSQGLFKGQLDEFSQGDPQFSGPGLGCQIEVFLN